MSEQLEDELPELPQEFPHIFTEVYFGLVPEINYGDLCHLSQIVKNVQRQRGYETLADCLRKIQWVKLSALLATSIEKDIAEHMEEDSVSFAPSDQIQHAKSICEFAIHTKSALDSLAVFLTWFLSLNAKKAERDFKHKRFRNQIRGKDLVLGQHIQSMGKWFDDLQEIRDVWIHKTSTMIFVTSEPSEVGVLPIPKKVSEGQRWIDGPVTKDNFWSTEEFVQFHYSTLISLFDLVVKRCIKIELGDIEMPPTRLEDYGPPMSSFPMRSIRPKVIKKMKFKL